MRRTSLTLLCLIVALQSLSVRALTDQQAAALSVQFVPQTVKDRFSDYDQLRRLPDPATPAIDPPLFYYLSYTMPGDPKQYVLLVWGCGILQDSYWRLLSTTDGTAYTVVQDAPKWYGPFSQREGGNCGARLQDLNNDGVPELLLWQGMEYEHSALVVFQWKNQRWECITPWDQGYLTRLGPDFWEFVSAWYTNQEVVLQDLDGDNVAEVIVYPYMALKHNPDATGPEDDFIRVAAGPTRIYKYDGSAYTLWKEIPYSAADPFPVSVPGIAVFQPSTLPLSSLSNPGNGKLRVLVSHPARMNTVDDMDTAQFKYNQTALPFKKRWTNNKQPETTSANLEWGGCPVKQVPKQGQGDWNVSPEDPALPSPDGKMEYHFVAPYLELELSRSAVYPYLLQVATDAFTKDPNRQTFFVEVPISGKMKNGKLAAVGATVCIKRTGSEKEAQGSPTPPLQGEQGVLTAPPAAQQETTSPAKR